MWTLVQVQVQVMWMMWMGNDGEYDVGAVRAFLPRSSPGSSPIRDGENRKKVAIDGDARVEEGCQIEEAAALTMISQM